jgi:hypothetical protein
MLPEDKVVATDMQLSAPALQVADVKLQVPAVYDPQYIDIPQELMNLANRMPDAIDILKGTDKQVVTGGAAE